MNNLGNNQKIEDILSSLNGVKSASVPDFFYTRLKARMEREIEKNRKPVRLLRPVYIVAGLLLIVTMNLFVFLNNDSTEETVVEDNDVAQQSIASEYKLNDVTYVYDINQDR